MNRILDDRVLTGEAFFDKAFVNPFRRVALFDGSLPVGFQYLLDPVNVGADLILSRKQDSTINPRPVG